MSLDWFRADWNRTVLFGPGGEGRKHLLPGGWGGDEPLPGIWSTSSIARMAFRLPQPRHQTFLAIEWLPFVPCPGIFSQFVEVQLNGRRLGECIMAEPEGRVAVFPVEDTALQAGPFAILSLILPNARCPESLGLSSDNRALGIRLYGIRWSDVWYDCQFGARVATTASKGANHHFLYGWSDPEPEFTWSERPTAMLVLRAPEHEGDMVFQAKVKPFVPRLDLPPQRIRMYANDRPVGEFAFRDPAPRVIEAKIPQSIVGSDRLVYLRFDVQSPRRPVDFGFGHDSRELGVAISEFSIELQEFTSRGAGLVERYAGASLTGKEVRKPPRISFTKESLSKSALVYGWDAPSEGGAAMLRSPAILAADLTGCQSPLDMICYFTVRHAEPGDEVAVRVEANGHPAGAFTLQGPNPSPQSLRLWPMTKRQKGLTYISFEWAVVGDGASVPVLSSVEFAAPEGSPPAFELAQSAVSFCFRPGSPGGRLLTDGWHGVTEEGALCLGRPCGLAVPVLYPKLPLNLDLEVSPTGSPDLPPGAQVVVEVNGRAANCFTPDAARKVRVVVSPVDLLEGSALAVRFLTSHSQAHRGSCRKPASPFGGAKGEPGIPFLLKGLSLSAPLDAGRSS